MPDPGRYEKDRFCFLYLVNSDQIQPQKDIRQKQEQPFLILAPLQGYTDLTFRNVFARHFQGIDQAMAPFISTMGHQRIKESKLQDMAPENNLLPVIPQMMGNDAEDLSFLANRFFDLGHDTVNWNLGCPHTKVAKKKRGSGLLPYPEIIDEILEKMLCQIRPHLTIKLRLGYRSVQEFDSLIPILNRHNLSEIIVHPRTGVQIYEGISDLDGFAAVCQHIHHPLTYNGDIVDGKSFLHIKKRFPEITRFMIGRGLLANPFLGEEIKGMPIDPSDRTRRLYQFHEELFNGYEQTLSGPTHVLNRMKGYWKFLGPSFENSKAPLKRLLKSRNIATLRKRADDLFAQCAEFSPEALTGIS